MRSVLKVTREQFLEIQNKMPSANKEQRNAKKCFMISNTERKMLTELKDLLEMFEFATHELQSNDVSISRVYPQIKTILTRLMNNPDNYTYTKELRIVRLFFQQLLLRDMINLVTK